LVVGHALLSLNTLRSSYSIHPPSGKVNSAKFAPAVFRWHHGFVDTATLREERSR
jgi:hypothetical protein